MRKEKHRGVAEYIFQRICKVQKLASRTCRTVMAVAFLPVWKRSVEALMPDEQGKVLLNPGNEGVLLKSADEEASMLRIIVRLCLPISISLQNSSLKRMQRAQGRVSLHLALRALHLRQASTVLDLAAVFRAIHIDFSI